MALMRVSVFTNAKFFCSDCIIFSLEWNYICYLDLFVKITYFCKTILDGSFLKLLKKQMKRCDQILFIFLMHFLYAHADDVTTVYKAVDNGTWRVFVEFAVSSADGWKHYNCWRPTTIKRIFHQTLIKTKNRVFSSNSVRRPDDIPNKIKRCSTWNRIRIVVVAWFGLYVFL